MNKISIIFPYLPKYDVDFIHELQNSNPDLFINIYADMSSNDLFREDSSLSSLKITHTKIYKFGPVWLMPGLFKILQNSEANEIVIFNANPRDLSQFLLMIFARIFRLKIIGWGMFHRIGGPRFYSTLYYKLVSIICQRVFVYGEMGRSNLLRLGVNENKIYKIGNAIKYPKSKPTRENVDIAKISILNEFPVLKNKFLLIQVVRLTEIKKPFIFIDLIKELKKVMNDFHIILIGGGELEPELKKDVKLNNLDEFITFLGPIYDEQSLSNWFSIADIFVMPTCIGLSAHQSMFYGLPVITDNSQINQASESEILIDGFNCLRYEEGDVQDFAKKIFYLKESPEMIKKLSFNASSNIDKFSMKKKVENFIKGISLFINN